MSMGLGGNGVGVSVAHEVAPGGIDSDPGGAPSVRRLVAFWDGPDDAGPIVGELDSC